jgi:hypothetical protein
MLKVGTMAELAVIYVELVVLVSVAVPVPPVGVAVALKLIP